MESHSDPFRPAKQAFRRMGKHSEQVFPLHRYVFQGEHYSGIVMRVQAKGVFRVVKLFLSVFLYILSLTLRYCCAFGVGPSRSLIFRERQWCNSKHELYRFVNGKPDYPEMIELLSRHPDILGEPKGLTIEPIPIDEEITNLPECTRRQV